MTTPAANAAGVFRWFSQTSGGWTALKYAEKEGHTQAAALLGKEMK
jgi:hypothetical protein